MGWGNRDNFILPALDKPKECSSCSLATQGEGFAAVEGTGYSGVAVVGEKLGAREVSEGLPLRPSGASGAIFERTLKKLRVPRASLKILNVIQCMPPENALQGTPYEWSAIEHCRVHRDNVLLDMPESSPTYKRKVILALGEIATRTLTGLGGKFDSLRGYPEETPYGLVVPTYNPAKLIAGREAKLIGVFRKDVALALRLAQEGWNRPAVKYLTEPTVARGWEFYERVKSAPADTFLAFDIENEYGQFSSPNARAGNIIKTVQFSLGKNEAIRFVWRDEFIPIIRAVLALGITKWGWNSWKHDAKILKDFDCPVAEPHLDGFWLFHHVEPDLTTEDTEDGSGISSRLGLQYAASLYGWYRRWKQLGSDDPEYQCIDVDVLQYIIPEIIAQAKQDGLWESYHRHVVRYYPILDDVTRRGIPVNEARRQEVRKELSADLVVAEAAIQEAYPKHLCNIHPKAGFVRPPKWDDKNYRLVRVGGTEMPRSEWHDSDDDCWRPMELRKFDGLKVKQKQQCDCFVEILTGKNNKLLKKPKKLYKADCPKCAGKKTFTEILTEQQRWCCVLPFKASKDQIVKYMLWAKHRPPKKRGGGGKFTTEFKELEKLAVKHPGPDGQLYTKIVAKRKLEKVIATYIDGWVPAQDGCVHGELLMATATGQLNAIKPNILNPYRADSPLGIKFNSMVQAPKGRVFVDMDFKSFHGATLAALSGDEVYYKVAVLAGDAHSFLTSHLVGEPLDSSVPLELLIEQLKDIKSRFGFVRNNTAKPANLGWGFGLKGPGLYDRYQEFFPQGKQQAVAVMDLLDKLYWRVAAFRKSQAQQAAMSENERILSPTGHHRRFYSVYTWRQQKDEFGEAHWSKQDGPDMEDVYAFSAANTAHCHFRDVQAALESLGVLEKYWFMLPFHDALKWCPLESEVDELIKIAYKEMTRPIKELAHPVLCPDGLVVGVDVKIGKSWDAMENYKLKGN